jgi:hypothetical protein
MVLLRKDIEFKAWDGTTLRGWLYLQPRKSPRVIMSHGVGDHFLSPLPLSLPWQHSRKQIILKKRTGINSWVMSDTGGYLTSLLAFSRLAMLYCCSMIIATGGQ